MLLDCNPSDLCVHSVYAALLEAPITWEEAESRGLQLFACFPLMTPSAVVDPSARLRYLAVLSFPARIDSDWAFDSLAIYGIYSWHWLTYFLEGDSWR